MTLQNLLHHPIYAGAYRWAVYLAAAAKYRRCTHRLSQEQKGLDERALMVSQRPLTSGDALDAGPAHARRRRRPPYLAAFYHPACSHLRWLEPRRHAKEDDLPQSPHVVGQASGHRWRTRPPL